MRLALVFDLYWKASVSSSTSVMLWCKMWIHNFTHQRHKVWWILLMFLQGPFYGTHGRISILGVRMSLRSLAGSSSIESGTMPKIEHSIFLELLWIRFERFFSACTWLVIPAADYWAIIISEWAGLSMSQSAGLWISRNAIRLEFCDEHSSCDHRRWFEWFWQGSLACTKNTCPCLLP